MAEQKKCYKNHIFIAKNSLVETGTLLLPAINECVSLKEENTSLLMPLALLSITGYVEATQY